MKPQSAIRILVIMLVAFISTSAMAETRGMKKITTKPEETKAEFTKPARNPEDPDYYALLIGNNEYQHWPKLSTAVKDVEGMYEVLKSVYGFQDSNIFLYKNASRRDIQEGFSQLRKHARDQDNVLIYYGGHGHFDETDRGYWVPVEGATDDVFDYISNDDILGMLAAIKANHKFLISDSCFSGNLLTKSRGLQKNVDPRASRFFQEKSRLASVQGMTSGGNEPVSDGGAQWGGHSVFAFHLIAQLRANHDPYLSASILGNKLAELVANDTASMHGGGVGQTPIIQPIKGQRDQGGEFFFLRQAQLDKKIVVVYVPSDKTEFEETTLESKNIIQKAITDKLSSLGFPFDPITETISASDLGSKLPETLKQKEAGIALVFQISGEMIREATLMWQGKSRLAVGMDAYVLEDNQLKLMERYEIQPQVLPIRKWDESAAFLGTQYQKTAEKVVKYWSEERLGQFLFNLAFIH
ncbi:MAG: caspase family protein [SAR324 cluster bacterium]|nr:caspase family protein [SAR324 cluster bacterium]